MFKGKTVKEGEKGSLCDLPRQQWEQKFGSVLLIDRNLQIWNTCFMTSTLGWPSLECQVVKEDRVLLPRGKIANNLSTIYRFSTRIWTNKITKGRIANKSIILSTSYIFSTRICTNSSVYKGLWLGKLKQIKELVKTILSHQPLEENLFRNLWFHQTEGRVKFKID